jgi:glycosyltransferase involved in cell wall biosynthesis
MDAVPPKLHGSVQRVVSSLTEELVSRGHDVTLFASGDSQTSAKLIPTCPTALRMVPDCLDNVALHALMLETISKQWRNFDIIHFHLEYLHFSLARTLTIPCVTTMHHRLDLSYLMPLFDEFRDAPVVAVSNAQKRALPWLNWQETVHHGLPLNNYTLTAKPGEYLLFVGKIAPDKRVDSAIEIAKKTGMPLKIAAKVDAVDQDYHKQVIKPLLHEPGIEFLGEVSEGLKNKLIGDAYALLSTTQCPEPFGIVLIEALACGTPIVALRHGMIPEIVHHGITGFICNDVQQAVSAVEKVSNISRHHCRADFEARFTSARMTQNYLRVYEKLLLVDEITAAQPGGELWAVRPPGDQSFFL